MPLSVRLPVITAAAHQCTFSTTAPSGTGALQMRFAGTTNFSVRLPNGGSATRMEWGNYVIATNSPSSGVAELCIADGVEHFAIVSFLRDVMTYLGANNPATDQLGAQEMVRATRTILDFVRTNTLKA